MFPYCGTRKTRQASFGSPPCKCPHTCSRTKSDYKQFKKYLYASGMSSHEGTRQVHVRWESDWPPSPMLAQGRQNEAMRKVCSICLLYLPARLTMFAMKFRPAQILILLVLLCLLTSSMFAQGPVILSADVSEPSGDGPRSSRTAVATTDGRRNVAGVMGRKRSRGPLSGV